MIHWTSAPLRACLTAALLYTITPGNGRAAEPPPPVAATAEPRSEDKAKCSHCTDDTPLQSLMESITPWHTPEERKVINALDLKATDQDGKEVNLKDLLGQPVAISFFYSRCSNANKCPLAVKTMGKLAGDVKNAG